MALPAGRYGLNNKWVDDFGNLVDKNVDYIYDNGFASKNLADSLRLGSWAGYRSESSFTRACVPYIQRKFLKDEIVTLSVYDLPSDYNVSMAYSTYNHPYPNDSNTETFGIGNLVNAKKNGIYTVTIPVDCYINIQIRRDDDISFALSNVQNVKIQFELGKATPYEPYAKSNVELTNYIDSLEERKEFTLVNNDVFSNPIDFYKLGNTVNVRLYPSSGPVSQTTHTWTIMGSIPEEFRPKTRSIFLTLVNYNGTHLGALQIDVNGNVSVWAKDFTNQYTQVVVCYALY